MGRCAVDGDVVDRVVGALLWPSGIVEWIIELIAPTQLAQQGAIPMCYFATV